MSEFRFPATLSVEGGLSTITALNFNDAEPVKIADSRHPHFHAIVSGLRHGDPNVWSLFDVAKGVMAQFEQVTDRFSWNGSEVLFDGDVLHDAFGELLGRAISEGNPDNYRPLALFGEKLASNPDDHSRTQAYDWLACHKFQITPEGDVVGYKGVNRKGDSYESGYASTVSGVPSAFVNGKPVPPLSRVPQNIGDVVTMPRSEVAHDPRQACKRGLHVATFDYAGGYGNVGTGTILEVHVNPRDIVSVPTDAKGAKVRVCRYKVASVAKAGPGDTAVLRPTEPSKNVWAGDVGYRVN